jgi:hypothetical protein
MQAVRDYRASVRRRIRTEVQALKFVTPPSLAGIILYGQTDLVDDRKGRHNKHWGLHLHSLEDGTTSNWLPPLPR